METSLTTPIDGYTLSQSKRKPKNAITATLTNSVSVQPLDVVKPEPTIVSNQRVVTHTNSKGVTTSSVWSVISNEELMPAVDTMKEDNASCDFDFKPLPLDVETNLIGETLAYEYKGKTFTRSGFKAELIKDMEQRFGIDLTIEP